MLDFSGLIYYNSGVQSKIFSIGGGLLIRNNTHVRNKWESLQSAAYFFTHSPLKHDAANSMKGMVIFINKGLFNRKLFKFIDACPTPFHSAEYIGGLLRNAGFTELRENEEWKLVGGCGYYTVRGGSSLTAFRMPEREYTGFMITASHCDSPCIKIKENAEIPDGFTVRLSSEVYGGMLCSSWLDRPLSVAGRIIVKTGNRLSPRTVRLPGVQAIIPNVAIHMNRNANDGTKYSASVDMIPLYRCDDGKKDLLSAVASAAGTEKDDILSSELMLFNPESGVEWNGFISAPRLDDLQCVYASLSAFLRAGESGSIPVFAVFDNEEIGSQTMQGAGSTFLYDVLGRIVNSSGGDHAAYCRLLAGSCIVSCDNAHAVHPNHTEYRDPNHCVYMNGGVVIKYNSNKRYTTDSLSEAFFRLICGEAGVPVQLYANRSDMVGGSTLGCIANTKVSVNTVDVGLAQLAMHSAMETAGADDTEYLERALKVFLKRRFVRTATARTD